MLACTGHTDGDFAHSISGVAPFYGLAPRCRLADCSREGGAAVIGLESKSTIERGRLVLLRSVLSAIPTFYLPVFKISASIEQRLSGLMRRFF